MDNDLWNFAITAMLVAAVGASIIVSGLAFVTGKWFGGKRR